MARSKKGKAAAKIAKQSQEPIPNGESESDHRKAADSLDEASNLRSDDDQDRDGSDDSVHAQLEDAETKEAPLSDDIGSAYLDGSDLASVHGSDEPQLEPVASPARGNEPNASFAESLAKECHENAATEATQKLAHESDSFDESERDILESYDSDDASVELVTAEFESVSSQTVQKVSTEPTSVRESLTSDCTAKVSSEPRAVESEISESEILLPNIPGAENSRNESLEPGFVGVKHEEMPSSPANDAGQSGCKEAVVAPANALGITLDRSTENAGLLNAQGPEVLLDRTPIIEAMRLEKLDQPIVPSKTDIDTTRSSSLLQSRFDRLNDKYMLKDETARTSILKGTENIKRTFNDIKDTVGGLSDSFSYGIDWGFWTQIVNDYELALKNDLAALYAAVLLGIPKEFRGIVWQLVSRSKNFELEELYMQLKTEPSAHEKSIKRDLTRTSFFTNVEQVKKSDELYNVIKAYSLFDPDVGYTQGMIFIAVPLIMNISEAECFSLLVTLMKDYGLRDLFCPDMRGLHLMLYQFDRFLETRSPLLYNHLVRQGIKSSMYASQWFLTFFAYKFPLSTVLRIYDILITQGIEAILKFAVNLMMVNEHQIMGLKFDALLAFLKNDLFEVYANSNIGKDNNDGGGSRTSTRRISAMLGAKPSSPLLGASTEKYDLDKYVADSLKLELVPNELMQYEQEFDRIYQDEADKAKLIQEARIENGKLRQRIKTLEMKYLSLNYEHLEAVQQMVHVQFSLPELYEQHGDLANAIRGLKQDIEELEMRGSGACESPDTNPHETNSIPLSIDQNIQNLLQVNAEQAELCANLEDELALLTLEEASLDEEINARSKKWFKW